jgi:CBASS immunity sensor of nucleotide second messenger signals
VEAFPAVPVTAAVALGRAPMRDIHPRLRVYDRTADGRYEFALEVVG